MGTRRYVLSVDNDNDFRSRCEWIWVRLFGSTTCVCFTGTTVEKLIKNREKSWFLHTQKMVWCDDPPEVRVISIVAGCLANHDRAHRPHSSFILVVPHPTSSYSFPSLLSSTLCLNATWCVFTLKVSPFSLSIIGLAWHFYPHSRIFSFCCDKIIEWSLKFMILPKATTLSINLNSVIDDNPIVSRSHIHPSHSQTWVSRLISSSLSLGVPFPPSSQCVRLLDPLQF
jgi:hypothetical protein